MGHISIKYLDICYNNKNVKKYERNETFVITGHLYIGDRHISIHGDNISIDDGKNGMREQKVMGITDKTCTRKF